MITSKKISAILTKLLALTIAKKCLWKNEQVIINDNNQTAFFNGFKVYLDSGWVFLYSSARNTFNINFGKCDNLVYTEMLYKGSLYTIAAKLYKEITRSNDSEDTLDQILKELS